MLGPGLGWEAANPGGSTSPALHRPRLAPDGRTCPSVGRRPRLRWPWSRLPLLQAWASREALWELRASPPPSRPSLTETRCPPPRLGREPHPWPGGCHSLQFSDCVPGGEPGCKLPGQEAVTGSVDDRDPCTPVRVPRLSGRWRLRLAPGWNTALRPSRQKGSSRRCPAVTAVGPPGKPAHRSRHRVCVPGICGRAALRAFFWAGCQGLGRRPAGLDGGYGPARRGRTTRPK